MYSTGTCTLLEFLNIPLFTWGTRPDTYGTVHPVKKKLLMPRPKILLELAGTALILENYFITGNKKKLHLINSVPVTAQIYEEYF
jgi:hypothetical protein